MIVRLAVMFDAVVTTMQEVTLTDVLLLKIITELRSDVIPPT
jgi:hypothetical protein